MSGTDIHGQPFKEVKHRGLITIFVMVSMMMVIIDLTIANVALPHMQSSLGAAQDTITWVITSYVVAQAIATPITGWLADNVGRKKLYAICVGGFVLTSALCGAATGLEEMVFFRVMQGAFGAALAPLSQSVILDINPRERHGQAMALWGSGLMLAPIIGPTVGAYLTETFNWRWVFYINVPIGLASLAGLLIFMPDTLRRIRRFDFYGFAYLSLAVGSLQLMLDRGTELDWFSSPEIVIETGIAIAAGWMFIVHTVASKDPFLDKRLFTDRNFVPAMVLIFLVGMVLLATLALLPPMLANLMGYPIMTVGWVLAPRGFGTMVAMMIVGRLIGKVDPRLLVFFGLSITAYSLYMMTDFTVGMSSWTVLVAGLVQGVGMGFVFVPLSTVAFRTLDPSLRTDGSGLFNLVRNVGSSIGVSVTASLLIANSQINHAELATHINAFSPNLGAVGIDAAALLTEAGAQTAAQLNGLISQQALMIAYINDFKIMYLTTICAMPLILLLRFSRQKPDGSLAAQSEKPAIAVAD
jgi:DHA2 family multidrug resistance protein